MFVATLFALGACGPEPPVWPARFRLAQRRIPDDPTAGNASTVTYYDSIAGANLILITPDANKSDVLWDLELNTKKSFYFTPARRTCQRMSFPVGILRPDWLANASYLGITACPYAKSKRCSAWTKAQFIDYYADLKTCEPVAWYFWSMKAMFTTVQYTADARAPAGYFQPPAYC